MASIIKPEPGKGKKPKTDTISNPGAKSTKPKRKIIGGGNVITNPGGKPIKKVIKRLSQQLKTSVLKPAKARTIDPSRKRKPVQPKRPGGR